MTKRINLILLGIVLLAVALTYLFQGAEWQFGDKQKANGEIWPRQHVIDSRVAPEGYFVEFWSYQEADTTDEELVLMAYPKQSPLPFRLVLDHVPEDRYEYQKLVEVRGDQVVLQIKKSGGFELMAFSLKNGSQVWKKEWQFPGYRPPAYEYVTEIHFGADSTLNWFAFLRDSSMVYFEKWDWRTGESVFSESYPWVERLENYHWRFAEATGGWLITLESEQNNYFEKELRVLGRDLKLLTVLDIQDRDNGVMDGKWFFHYSPTTHAVVKTNLANGKTAKTWPIRDKYLDPMLFLELKGAWSENDSLLFWISYVQFNWMVAADTTGGVRVDRMQFYGKYKSNIVDAEGSGRQTISHQFHPYTGRIPHFIPMIGYSTQLQDHLGFWDTRARQLYLASPTDAGKELHRSIIFRVGEELYGFLRPGYEELFVRFAPDAPTVSGMLNLGICKECPGTFTKAFREDEMLLGLSSGGALTFDLNSFSLKYPSGGDSLAPVVTEKWYDELGLPAQKTENTELLR